jgi:hypothetical protein
LELTSYQKVADALLRTQGTTLPIVVLDLADQNVPLRHIARHLFDRTDGAIDVTGQAVKNWIDQFRENETREVA